MESDRLHPRAPRELTDVVARLHSVPLKGHAMKAEGGPSLLEKSKCCTSLQKRPKANPMELQPGQPHSNPWEVHKVNPLGAHFSAHKEGDR